MTPETTCPYCRGTFRALALSDALDALYEERLESAAWRAKCLDKGDCARAFKAERDAALAREARLRAAAERAITMIGWDGGEARRDLEAAIEADTTATTWLADRERAAAVRVLRWAIEHSDPEAATSVLREMADAIEAGKEPTP